MKQVKYDKKKHAQEKKETKAKEKINKVRLMFLESLKDNQAFQKYVVEEIIQKYLMELDSLSRIEKLGIDLGKKEEVADLVVQAIMAKKQLQKMLNDLL